MLTVIFLFLMFFIFGRILMFAIRAAWGISKLVCSIILLPLFLTLLVVKGLVEIALPILIIVGMISFFSQKKI